MEDLECDEDYMALTRFTVLTMEFCKWINCDLRDEKVVQGREETSNLCLQVLALALNHKRIPDGLCKDQNQRTTTTEQWTPPPPPSRNGEDRWAASVILLFSDIIDTRFSIITNQVPTCSAFKVAAEEATETPIVAAAIQLNEFFSDMLSGR